MMDGYQLLARGTIARQDVLRALEQKACVARAMGERWLTRKLAPRWCVRKTA